MSATGWVGKEDIGIPAKGMFLIVFTSAGYLGLCGIINVVLTRLYKVSVSTDPSASLPMKLLALVYDGKASVAASDSFIKKLFKTKQFWYRLMFVVLASAVGGSHIGDTCGGTDGNYCANWHLMFWYSLAIILTANISLRPHEFYLGEGVSFTDMVKFYVMSKPPPTEQEIEKRVRELAAGEETQSKSGIGFWTLMPSVFITWIFAKSVRNSSVLGARFGMLGGFAYDSWYLSFFSSAIVCYFLRTRFNFKSLPTAIHRIYGPFALFAFQLCVLFRVFNEVWSNATVIGGFYGPSGSSRFWGACWFSVLVPATYVMMGGMRSSLFSDVFQAGLAVAFLVVVLATIASDKDFPDAFSYSPPPSIHGVNGWEPGWWAYTIAGTVGGCISYPWFDPVLTDRAFLGTPTTMIRSFFAGGTLAMLFIFFYAAIGVYGAWAKEKYVSECGCSGGSPSLALAGTCPDWNPCSHLVGSLGEASDVAFILGHRTFRGAEVFINLVMITASMSTLDSTFTSASKLVSLEYAGWLKLPGDNRAEAGPLRPVDIANIGKDHIMLGRIFVALLAIIGTSFLGYEKDAMRATTVAGMSVMGIGMPIWWMAVWKMKQGERKGWRQAPLAFLVPFAVGWFIGISYYIQGNDNTTRKEWCTAQNLGGDCVTSQQGWTYGLSIGTFTKANGDEKQYTYGRYLGTMLLGHGIVIALFFIFFVFHQFVPLTPMVEPEETPKEEAKAVVTEEKIWPQVGLSEI